MGQGASQQIVAARVEGPQFKQLSPQSVVLAHGILRNEVEVLESPQKVVRRALGNIQETAHVGDIQRGPRGGEQTEDGERFSDGSNLITSSVVRRPNCHQGSVFSITEYTTVSEILDTSNFPH